MIIRAGSMARAFFSRGDLPEVVECRRTYGNIPAGAVLRWSTDPAAPGYVFGSGVVLAGFVRARWGLWFDHPRGAGKVAS